MMKECEERNCFGILCSWVFFLSGATRGSSNVMPIIHLFPTEIPFQNFCFVCVIIQELHIVAI